MNLIRKNLEIRHVASLALCLIALAVPGIASAVEAGNFQFVHGDIKVISASGAERKPVKGEAFNSGDTVITGRRRFGSDPNDRWRIRCHST